MASGLQHRNMRRGFCKAAQHHTEHKSFSINVLSAVTVGSIKDIF
jgi:hypothetical protein